MNKKTRFSSVRVVFSFLLTVSACVASAALNEATTSAGGKSYSDSTMWAEGDYPDGRGAILNVGGKHTLGDTDASPALDKNVTLGTIRRKADAARAYTMFFIPGINHGYDIPNEWDPMRGAEHQNGVNQATCSDRNVMTNAITMWATGNEPAKIASETPRFDETGSDKSTVNAEIKKQVWMMIDVPLVLKSDLLLTHEGVVASQIGSLSTLETNGRVVPYAAIELGGPISTPSGEFHDLIVSNPVYRGSALRSESTKYIHNAVMLQGENTFKGNVRVKEGVLRLSGEAGFRGTIRQLGDGDNKVYVSAEGAVDLMGGKTPASHHLYLGGKSASTTFGNLYSSDLDPLALAEWCGPVTLTGDAAIGGYPSSTQLSDNSGATKNVLDSDGNLRVSGAIDGAFDISVRGARQIEFAGDNSAFTGNMVLEGTGARTRFVNDAALPSNGRLVLNGGVIRVGAATDGDVSRLGAKLDTTTNNKRLMFDITEGVTYNPAQGFVSLNNGFAKTGKGRMVVDKTSTFNANTFYLEEGETVFDFTGGATSLWGESATGDGKGSFHLANDACMTVKVPDGLAGHGFKDVTVKAGMFPRLRLETESDFKVQNFTVDADGFLMVDPLTGAGNVLTKTTPNGGPLGNGNVFYGETTFACRGNPGETYGTLQGFPDASYATAFDGVSVGASDAASSAVDVTAELVAGGPVSFANRILRFNTPAAGKEIVVNMTGFTNVVSGTILITPNLGDTHVIFRGGALTAPADGSVRIVNLNTNANAYVEIDCDVVSGGWALSANNRAVVAAPKVNLLIAGRGRTVFKGENETNLGNYFIDCAVELPVNGLLRNHTNDDGDNRDRCFVNGATFLATGDINLAGLGYLGSKKGSAIRFEPTVGRLGLTLGAAAGKTLTIARAADVYFKDGSSINTIGPGTVQINATLYQYSAGFGGQTFGENIFPTELVMRSKVTDGILSGGSRATACNDFFGQRPIRVDVSDGVTFAGPSFLHAAGETSTAIPLCDFGRRQSFVVPKGATATFDRATGAVLIYSYNWYGLGMPAMYAKASGHFAGDGTIVLTDSVDATAGIRPTGESHPNFRGTLRAEVPYIAPGDGWTGSLGVMYPNATFEIPAGKMQSFAQAYKDYFAVRLGALSGSGTYSVTGVADSRACSWTYVGCDDASRTAEFTGTLSGVYASPLVKIGKSTQKFSGAGELKGTVRVRDGTLVIGHTNAFSYVDGARYYDYVLLGDGKTTAGMEPQFLAEGVDVVKNPVRVIACADASVTPVVGVASGTTTFAKLTVSNNVKVVANAAGSKATIRKLTMLDDCDVSVGGSGEVVFEGDVTLPAGVGASFGTTFTVGGKLTVGEGAAFALSDLPDELDQTKAYVLVSADGGIEGTFDFSGVTLPKGWVLQQKADKVVLKFQMGLILIVR